MPRRKKWLVGTTGVVVFDSGAVTQVAENRGTAVTLVRSLTERGWSLLIPTVALVECLTGDPRRDANANRFIRAVGNFGPSDEQDARLAAERRHRTNNPSVVDALVAAAAMRLSGPSIILTTDPNDLKKHVEGNENVRVLAC